MNSNKIDVWSFVPITMKTKKFRAHNSHAHNHHRVQFEVSQFVVKLLQTRLHPHQKINIRTSEEENPQKVRVTRKKLLLKGGNTEETTAAAVVATIRFEYLNSEYGKASKRVSDKKCRSVFVGICVYI